MTSIPMSNTYVKSTIRERMYAGWNRRWQEEGDCRQTFLFFLCNDVTKSRAITRMGWKALGIMIRCLTGHSHLRRHNRNCQHTLGNVLLLATNGIYFERLR